MTLPPRLHELLGSLRPGFRPLEGKVVYMHAVKSRHSMVLTDRIKRLGGSIEAFLNRDVSFVVTGQREGKKAPSPGTSKDGAKTMTNESKNPSQTQVRLSVLPLCGSRGRALLQKAMNNNQERCNSSDVLANARSWGVKILHVDDFMWCLDLLTEHSKQKRKVQAKAPPVPSQGVVKAFALKTPFIKIEDASRKYRPLFSQAMKFPELNYNSRFSPFEQPKSQAHKPKSRHHQENKDEGGSAVLATTPTTTPRRSSQKPSRKKGPGYCECCQQTYLSLEQHVDSKEHLCFVEDTANYAVLDQLIGSLECPFLFNPTRFQDLQLFSSSLPQDVLVTADVELKTSSHTNQRTRTHSPPHTHTPTHTQCLEVQTLTQLLLHTHSPEKLADTHTPSWPPKHTNSSEMLADNHTHSQFPQHTHSSAKLAGAHTTTQPHQHTHSSAKLAGAHTTTQPHQHTHSSEKLAGVHTTSQPHQHTHSSAKLAGAHTPSHFHQHTHSPEKLTDTYTLSHTQSPEMQTDAHTLSRAHSTDVQTHTHTFSHTPENWTHPTTPYPEPPSLVLRATPDPPTLQPQNRSEEKEGHRMSEPLSSHSHTPAGCNDSHSNSSYMHMPIPSHSHTPVVSLCHPIDASHIHMPLLSQSHTCVVPRNNPTDSSHIQMPLPSQSHTPVVPPNSSSSPSHIHMPLLSQSHTCVVPRNNPTDSSHIQMPLPSQSHTPVVPPNSSSSPSHIHMPLLSQSHTCVVPRNNPTDSSHKQMPLPSQSHTPVVPPNSSSSPSHIHMLLPSQSLLPVVPRDNPTDSSHIQMPLPYAPISPASFAGAALLLVEEHRMEEEPSKNETDQQMECATPSPKRRRVACDGRGWQSPSPPSLATPPHCQEELMAAVSLINLGPPVLYPYYHHDAEGHHQRPSSPPMLSPRPSGWDECESGWSESEWDSGLLLRLTPAVSVTASRGTYRVELEQLLESRTGLQDSSYQTSLCSALQQINTPFC